MSESLNPLDNIKLLRKFAGLDQTEFWGAVGVSQSGGSRYESGREIPRPVRELLRLVYIERLDLSRVRRADVEMMEYLRSERQALYKKLQKEAAAWRKKQPPN